MEFNKKGIKTILLILFSAILFYLAVQNAGIILGIGRKAFAIVFPFVLGAMVAFILNVPMNRVEHSLFREKEVRGRRVISFLLTVTLVIGVLSIAMYIIIPQIAVTLQSIAKRLPGAFYAAEDFVNGHLGYLKSIEQYSKQLEVDWDDVVRKLSAFLQSTATTMVNSGIGAVSNIIGAVVNFCIGLVFAVYILFAKEKLNRQGKQILYALFSVEVAEKILYVCTLAQKTFARFISGQCLEACILGFMFFIAMSILGMPYAMLISVLLAFSALIPIVGAFIGCFIGVVLILMVSPMKALIFVIMFLLLQQIEGNLIYPHVVGNSVGLPSIWVLVAVTVGGKLLGVAGMILFIPLVSVLYSLFRLYVRQRLAEKHIGEEKWTRTMKIEASKEEEGRD